MQHYGKCHIFCWKRGFFSKKCPICQCSPVGLVGFLGILQIPIGSSNGNAKGAPLHSRDGLRKIPIMGLFSSKCLFFSKMGHLRKNATLIVAFVGLLLSKCCFLVSWRKSTNGAFSSQCHIFICPICVKSPMAKKAPFWRKCPILRAWGIFCKPNFLKAKKQKCPILNDNAPFSENPPKCHIKCPISKSHNAPFFQNGAFKKGGMGFLSS